jgi:hypothetical protein
MKNLKLKIMEKLDGIKKEMIDRLGQISPMLRRGDERSKKIAGIATHLHALSYMETGARRTRLLEEISDIYTEMQVKYNREMYEGSGGKIGSGKMVAATEKDPIHDIAIKKISGIDVNGFNTIQINMALMQDPMSRIVLGQFYGDDKAADEFFNFVYRSLWTLLLCCYNNKSYAEKIEKIVCKFPAPSLN